MAESDAERLETLKTLLQSAATLVAEITQDPAFARLVRIFFAIEPGDREPILAMLEREVQVKRTVEAGGEVLGVSLRPNPGAYIYTRVIAEEPRPNRGRAVLAALRAMRAISSAVAPMDTEWKTITRDALRGLDSDERASMVRFTREVIEVLEECERAGGT